MLVLLLSGARASLAPVPRTLEIEALGGVWCWIGLGCGGVGGAMACRVMMSAAPGAAAGASMGKASPGAEFVGPRPGGARMPMHLANPPCSLAFVYGTLKQGFSNHWLIADVVGAGHAHFIGVAKTKQLYPLVCGPFQVPFLLNMPNSGLHVKGELYAVSTTVHLSILYMTDFATNF